MRTALSPRLAIHSRVHAQKGPIMARGAKSKYTDKQERKADHIAESYEERGVSEKEAERRAWATVNKDDGGGKRVGGSGRGKTTGHPAARKGGRRAGRPLHRDRRPAVQRPPGKPLPPASATPSIIPTRNRMSAARQIGGCLNALPTRKA